MPKFKIYAGLSGSHGGAQYCGVYECADRDEAETYAREQAVEVYESSGFYTWDSMRQEIADDEYDGDIEQVDPEDVDMRLMEEVESWLTYKVIRVQDDFPLDWSEEDDDYNDDDSDCYCE